MSTPMIVKPIPVGVSDNRATGWWGMVLFILAEAVLFASFIASYFFIMANSNTWPLGGIEEPTLFWPSVGTVLLVGSSVPMFLADRSAQQGHQAGLRAALAVAWVMAALFLALQVREFRRESFGLADTAYGSLFLTITGLHGLHVVTALIMSLVIQVRVWLGHFTPARRLAITNVGLYWHFVDAVWIVIFISLYLSPHWIPTAMELR